MLSGESRGRVLVNNNNHDHHPGYQQYTTRKKNTRGMWRDLIISQNKCYREMPACIGYRQQQVMLACVSPCDAHYEETLGTLRYAERAKKMKTTAVRNARNGRRSGRGYDGGDGQTALVERCVFQPTRVRLFVV